MVVGDRLVHREEAREICTPSEVGWGGRKRERRVGPRQQAEGFQTAQGGPEMFPSDSTDEAVEFSWRVLRDLASADLASPRDHLLGGKPDTEVPKLDEPAAIRPPYEAELLDEEKTKPPVGLFRCEFWIGSCSHVASLV